MPLRAEYTLHHSDLGEFLNAPVWEDMNGTSLSVLSALARLDIDPWAEAARLAALPRGTAASALTAILHRLPGRQPEASDAITIAARLVRLLPEGGSATSINGDAGQRRRTGTPVHWLLLGLMVILFIWAMKGVWF